MQHKQYLKKLKNLVQEQNVLREIFIILESLSQNLNFSVHRITRFKNNTMCLRVNDSVYYII